MKYNSSYSILSYFTSTIGLYLSLFVFTCSEKHEWNKRTSNGKFIFYHVYVLYVYNPIEIFDVARNILMMREKCEWENIQACQNYSLWAGSKNLNACVKSSKNL